MFGKRVVQIRRVRRPEGPGRVRPFWLQPQLHAVVLREALEAFAVLHPDRFEHAQHEHRQRIADGDFDLRNAPLHVEGVDQCAQRPDQGRHFGREHLAARHLGDVARLALAKPDQRSALFRHPAHRHARPVPVSPGKPVQRPQHRLGANAAQVPERVLEHALLGGYLRAFFDVLHRASAAGAEEDAARGNSRRAFALDPHDPRGFPRGLFAVSGVLDELARNGIVDEHRLALDVGHAAALPVEGLDKRDRHAAPGYWLQRPTNSRQCASPDLANVSRTNCSSLRYCSSSHWPRIS